MVSCPACKACHSSLIRILEKIVAALLATAVLTMLWIPYALLTNLGRNRSGGGSVRNGLLHEGSGGFIVWIMWLVCAAIYTVCAVFSCLILFGRLI